MHTMATITYSLSQRDAVSWLSDLPDASADLIVTDPPYESLEKHRAVGTTTRLAHSDASSNPWFATFPDHRFPELFAELFRVLRDDRHCYMFCDHVTMFAAKPAGEAAGFRFWKPLVWDKRTIGMGYHYRARYEFVLFFEKGKRTLADLGVADVIAAPRLRTRCYPTEKPVAVPAVLIAQSSSPGDLVIDPFCGSGSTGVAALQANRRFAGCDTGDEAIALARQRLTLAGGIEGPQGTSIARGQLRLVTM
jgi:site-specific DNA-methyltransferase (adenine-specific)